MTEEEQKINKALGEAGENLEYAAVILGIGTRKLRGLIDASPDLSRRMVGIPPSEGSTLAVSPKIAVDVRIEAAQEAQLAKALTDSDARLAQGLAGLGYTEDEVRQAVALQQLAAGNIKSTFELMHGGLTKTFIDCQIERKEMLGMLRDLIALLKDQEALPLGSKERWKVFGEAQEWAKRIREIDDMVIRTNEVIHKGALAMVQARHNQPTKSKRPKFVAVASDV
jgi:hypothetical protein